MTSQDTRQPNEVVNALVSRAKRLLLRATRLHDHPDESWNVAHVTKTVRPPLVFDFEEYDDVPAGGSPEAK